MTPASWVSKAVTVATLAVLNPWSSAQAQPMISVTEQPDSSIELSWLPGETAWRLESTATLTPPRTWTSVAAAPAVDGQRWSVRLDPSSQTRFFRLTRVGVTTTVESTSPAAGESGVAVTRETIFRLTGPLAEATVVTPEHFHAEAGGRRLLTRAHLSQDRRTLTLFYLENLPASSLVRTTLVGSGLETSSGENLDANGDGTQGGTRIVEFNTAPITPVSGTAVVGQVLNS